MQALSYPLSNPNNGNSIVRERRTEFEVVGEVEVEEFFWLPDAPPLPSVLWLCHLLVDFFAIC